MIAFTTDIPTLCWGIGIILLAVAGSLVNPFFRRLRWPEEEGGAEQDGNEPAMEPETGKQAVAISVLLPVHEAQESLERHLEAFLTQDYRHYQVVVVAQKGDHATEDVLKRLRDKYGHLYYTMIPASSRYMSREKLQVTLGVKAAENEWIILSSPTCLPGRQWLNGMAAHLTEDRHIALGVVLLGEDADGYRRFRHIRTLYYLLRRAQRGTALRTHMANVAFRKSDFIAGKGYLGSLQLVRGELDFLVNKYAEGTDCAVVLSPCAWLVEEGVTRKMSCDRELYLMASSKYLRRMGSMKALRFLDALAPSLSLLVSAGTLAYAIYAGNWTLALFAAIALLALAVLRGIIAAKATRRFDPTLRAMLMPLYELALPWSRLACMWRYTHSDKTDFTSHKL